jgi:hypothetical protein
MNLTGSRTWRLLDETKNNSRRGSTHALIDDCRPDKTRHLPALHRRGCRSLCNGNVNASGGTVASSMTMRDALAMREQQTRPKWLQTQSLCFNVWL